MTFSADQNRTKVMHSKPGRVVAWIETSDDSLIIKELKWEKRRLFTSLALVSLRRTIREILKLKLISLGQKWKINTNTGFGVFSFEFRVLGFNFHNWVLDRNYLYFTGLIAMSFFVFLSFLGSIIVFHLLTECRFVSCTQSKNSLRIKCITESSKAKLELKSPKILSLNKVLWYMLTFFPFRVRSAEEPGAISRIFRLAFCKKYATSCHSNNGTEDTLYNITVGNE